MTIPVKTKTSRESLGLEIRRVSTNPSAADRAEALLSS